jgi:uncharacterized protein
MEINLDKKIIFSKKIIKFRWLVILLSIFLVLIAGYGIKKLKFSESYRDYFSKENPQLKALEDIEHTYGKYNNVLFCIVPEKGEVFTRLTLTMIEEMTRASWQIPYSTRVDSITNFQHTAVIEDNLEVKDLIKNASELSDEEIREKKETALNEVFLLNRLISADSKAAGVQVRISIPGKINEQNNEIASHVRLMVKDFENKFPGHKIYLTGMVMFDQAFSDAGLNDMKTLIPIMYILIVLMIFVLLRSFAATMATIMIIAMSTIVAMGMAGWLGIILTPPAISAPIIILTLAVADCIHILQTLLQQVNMGKNSHVAITESIRINLQPVFLTSITTMIGFLSMNISEVPPFRDLGNIVAIGVFAAFLLAIIFLPAMVAVIPVNSKNKLVKQPEKMEKFSSWVIGQRKILLLSSSLLMLVLGLGILKLELNDRFIEFFDESFVLRTDTDFVNKNLTGLEYIEYSLESGEENGINNPVYLKKLEKFVDWWREQPETLHVDSLTDIMKRLNRDLHGNNNNYYKIPENRELAAQYMLLYEMSLPFGLDLNHQINVDKSATRVTIIFKNLSTRSMLALEQRADNWLLENLPEFAETKGASSTIMFAHISMRNIKSMLKGTAMALILISFILIFALRSIKLGLLSLLPNLVPALMAYGLWGLVRGEINLAVSVVSAITLGIVVDDTVHFLSKYLRARKEHKLNAVEAVQYSFSSVGVALINTSIILITGFAVLSFSNFTINSAMGILVAVTIAFALLTDFLFLPPLLISTDK